MDPTVAFDPNRTQLSATPLADPNRTVAIGAGPGPGPGAGLPADVNRTVMLGSAPTQVAAGPAVAVEIVPGRDAAVANGPAREQFLLQVTAAARGGGDATFGQMSASRTAVNLCLVIDRSGSMEGLPLESVKMAAGHVVDLLGPNDVLSIVTFEQTVDVLLEPQRVTDKNAIKAGIGRLMAGNTTNLHGGISTALDLATRNLEGRRATRMIVLTDGDPTEGLKDFSSLTAFAAEIKNRGVSVTFLGFGPDYNEELLAGMAKRSGGAYRYVADPRDIADVFRSEFGKLSSTVARNLRLRMKPARWVTLKAPISAGSGTEVEFPLADLERGTSLSQVLDLEMPNHPRGWYRVLAGQLVYEDLLDGQEKLVDIDIVVEFTSDAARYEAPQDPRVVAAADVQLVAKAVERTVMGLKTGALDRTQALAELNKTQLLLTADGRTQEAREVTMAMQAIRTGDTAGAEKTLLGTAIDLGTGKK